MNKPVKTGPPNLNDSPKQEAESSINKVQFLIGIVALILGTIVYLVDRPPEATYFIKHFPINISLHEWIPGLFGRIGNFLPEFIHPFAFSCMTAAVAAGTRREYLFVCLFWGVINSLFEIGQKYGDSIARHVPEWFNGIPYLENTAGYFQRGVFDVADLAAIGLGSVAAYGVLCLTGGKRTGAV